MVSTLACASCTSTLVVHLLPLPTCVRRQSFRLVRRMERGGLVYGANNAVRFTLVSGQDTILIIALRVVHGMYRRFTPCKLVVIGRGGGRGLYFLSPQKLGSRLVYYTSFTKRTLLRHVSSLSLFFLLGCCFRLSFLLFIFFSFVIL
ncbi:uncharacterized protein BO95DRAFT_253362 [Aspergillus brunneoviolaceus CBS 621.78]|uniref:Uncharacterized protein n=1 Tax=Aspergillus brunneoviolaceus CBS 621.78 TaxID=1450534 RepID=A0ACD1FYH3_9EURO|nr:hypothetical protein BO95DRAFT_253362 [Aspergillus brunneoviolaceus CBS 621.78]RAH42002.1 hypothetical protein BO95DRAFT_253362 [Aspergillus brunneoviolaceus CBS 621.78]